MAISYRCAYCGSLQTSNGNASRVCQACGATQPEKAGSVSPGSITTETAGRRHSRAYWIVIGLVCLLILTFAAALLVLRRHGGVHSGDLPAAALHSRILAVDTPPIRTLPAGSDLSAMDIMRSSPANAASMFDTKLLIVDTPRAMNDLEGSLWYVGEVTNRSPDHVAVAPSVEVGVVEGGKLVETRTLTLSDLPPGAHNPIAFAWDGDPKQVQTIVFRWKPVQGYLATSPHHPQLETVITGHKRTPGSVTVNFSYSYHFYTVAAQGTITNHGDVAAQGTQVLITLRDTRNHVAGFKMQKIGPIAPGEQVRYDVAADQWGDPVATFDVGAVVTTPTDF